MIATSTVVDPLASAFVATTRQDGSISHAAIVIRRGSAHIATVTAHFRFSSSCLMNSVRQSRKPYKSLGEMGMHQPADNPLVFFPL